MGERSQGLTDPNPSRSPVIGLGGRVFLDEGSARRTLTHSQILGHQSCSQPRSSFWGFRSGLHGPLREGRQKITRVCHSESKTSSERKELGGWGRGLATLVGRGLWQAGRVWGPATSLGLGTAGVGVKLCMSVVQGCCRGALPIARSPSPCKARSPPLCR